MSHDEFLGVEQKVLDEFRNYAFLGICDSV
jgi:hypothetical protein